MMEDEITNYFVKKTVGEVLETLNEDQKKAVAYIISENRFLNGRKNNGHSLGYIAITRIGSGIHGSLRYI